jgi:Flp pilus assembly protein TadD
MQATQLLKPFASITSLTLATALLVCSTGCTTTGKEAAGKLDVPLAREIPQSSVINEVAAKDKPDGKAVFEWQHHFKPAPNESQRAQIKERLKKWSDDKSKEDLRKIADLQLAIGLMEDAEASYRQVLRLEPDNHEVLLDLAALYLRKRAFGKCFDFIARAKEYQTESEYVTQDYKFRYKFILGQALIARGDIADGRKIISDLIAFNKEFIPAYAALASSYIAQGKLQLAEFIAIRGLDRGGKDDPRLANIIAVIAQNRGDQAKADSWIERALEADPNFAPALVNRANQSIIRGYYESAENDLKKAINITPDSTAAHISMGILCKRTGRFDLAKNSFNKAIDLDPESSHARFNMAMLELDVFKNQTEALRLFHEVIQTSDTDSNVKEMARSQIAALRDNPLTF